MRHLVCAALFLARAVACCADTRHEITEAEEKLRLALLDADGTALAQLLADEYKVVHVNGREQSKVQFIDALTSGRAKFLRIESEEPEVREFGDTVLVIARWNNTIDFKGEQSAGKDRVTDVWMKRAGGWQLISSQASFIEPAT